jgi:glycosyltransferase involved in cell wall biosynthesis
MVKVCHISSAHGTFDTRILLKECCSLSANGYDVTLVIPGVKDEDFNGVKIRTVKKRSGRISRMTLTVFSVFRMALKVRARIYHFHDPELFFAGVLFKLMGKKVIFDVHENISAQIKTKEWLPFRRIVAVLFKAIDYFSAKLFYLILAEESYLEVYAKYKPKYEMVLNLPNLSFLDQCIVNDRSKLKNEIFYVGGVTFDRGIDSVVKALIILNQKDFEFTFHCVGPIEPNVLEQVERIADYEKIANQIVFYNSMKLDDAFEISKTCKVGLSILKPIENYKKSYSTKIFEYMAVQLPVITSNFDLYKNVVERFGCGFCVDPLNPIEIAEAIEKIFNDPNSSSLMGEKGRKAILSQFNWKIEEQKLLAFYKTISTN